MYFAKEVLDSSSEMRRKWEDEVKKVVAKSADQKPRWSTVSDLEIRRLYTPEDIKDMDFAKDIGYPNQFPFIRGNQPATGENIGPSGCSPEWATPRRPMSGGNCC